MAEAGMLTEREAASHPQSHVIYHAIGVEGRCEADLIRWPLSAECAVLLCSDGIWRPLAADDIYTIVCQADHPQEACDQLISTALARGGYDDATAVLVEIPESHPAAFASHQAHAAATVEQPLEAILTA
jgi:protein phosphatase